MFNLSLILVFLILVFFKKMTPGDALKRIRNYLSAGKLAPALKDFQAWVEKHYPELSHDIIQQSALFNSLERQKRNQTIAFEDHGRGVARINGALLQLTEECKAYLEQTIEKEEFLDKQTKITFIPPLHASNVDRRSQESGFETVFWSPEGMVKKAHFFYLFGDSRQAHESLFKRFGYYVSEGLNWDQETGACEPVSNPIFIEFKPKGGKNPQLMQIEVKKHLFSKFFEGTRLPRSKILQSKITDLLSSPKLEVLGEEDFVFILLTLDDFNWDKKITPQLVQSFIENFCKAELPESAPTFFFFFGIEYKKENESVKNEVYKAMEESLLGEKLSLLKPVALNDIAEWFSIYDVLIEENKEDADMAEKYFPDRKEIDMKDVLPTLEKIVGDFNDKFKSEIN